MYVSKATLKEFLEFVLKNWNQIAIRVFQDGRWQSLYLGEVKDDEEIWKWIQETWKEKRPVHIVMKP